MDPIATYVVMETLAERMEVPRYNFTFQFNFFFLPFFFFKPQMYANANHLADCQYAN